MRYTIGVQANGDLALVKVWGDVSAQEALEAQGFAILDGFEEEFRNKQEAMTRMESLQALRQNQKDEKAMDSSKSAHRLVTALSFSTPSNAVVMMDISPSGALKITVEDRKGEPRVVVWKGATSSDWVELGTLDSKFADILGRAFQTAAGLVESTKKDRKKGMKHE